MNFRSLTTIICLFSAHFALAQSPTMQRGSYFGLTGGVGAVWIVGQHNYGLPSLSGMPRTGYLGGVVGGVTFRGGHGIHVEGVFSIQKYDYQDIRNVYEIGRDVVIGKSLDFVYFRIPLTYRRIIGIKNGDTDIGDSKFFWGVGVEIGALYDVELDYTVNGETDERFVFNEAFNPNVGFPPSSDFILFNAMDVALTGSFGWERFLTQHIVFQAEMKGAVSALDINHSDWRITNEAGKYTPSRHAMFHFKCSLIYYVNKVERMDIY